MSAAARHPFDTAVALEPLPDGRLRGHTSAAYWNMVGAFGGVTAAVALNGILMRERLGDPVSLTVNFAAPLRAGAFEVEAAAVRTSRSTQHWSVRIVQGEARETVTNAVAVFGARRPTLSFTEAMPPRVAAREACEPFRLRTDMRWPRMYDLRYARGAVGETYPDSVTHVWISDAEPRPIDFLSLTAFCDTFLPRLYLRRPLPVPLGTVSFNVYYHADAAELAAHGAEPVLGAAVGQAFHGGYFDHQGQIWGAGGRLLATTQQMVWFKE